MKLQGKGTMHVRVLSPVQMYYEGPAEVVSAQNQVGPFDILANHANFFSLLSPGEIIVNTGARMFGIKITHGIVKVTNNQVTLFVDIQGAYLGDKTSEPTVPASGPVA